MPVVRDESRDLSVVHEHRRLHQAARVGELDRGQQAHAARGRAARLGAHRLQELRPLRLGDAKAHRRRTAGGKAPGVRQADGAEPDAEERGERPRRVAQAEHAEQCQREQQMDRVTVRVVAPVPEVVDGEERGRAQKHRQPGHERAVARPAGRRAPRPAGRRRKTAPKPPSPTAIICTWFQPPCMAASVARCLARRAT